MPWFYLSFADSAKPRGEQFLGATVVEAEHELLAIPRAWELGVNPGGEVKFFELPFITAEDIPTAAQKYVNKLVPREVVLAEPHMRL